MVKARWLLAAIVGCMVLAVAVAASRAAGTKAETAVGIPARFQVCTVTAVSTSKGPDGKFSMAENPIAVLVDTETGRLWERVESYGGKVLHGWRQVHVQVIEETVPYSWPLDDTRSPRR